MKLVNVARDERLIEKEVIINMKTEKKRYLKYFLIWAAGIWLSGMLTGCSQRTEETEPITISVMIRDFGRERTKYIDRLLEERENIHIEWTIVPAADYDMVFEQKVNAGELPDLFETKKTMTEKYAGSGNFVDFSEYLNKMPNLEKWMKKIRQKLWK